MNELGQLINEFNDVPSMPNVVIEALKVVKDENSGIKDLGVVIGYDQSLLVKVLKLANSAYYGFSQQITSITRALSILGMHQAKNIIIANAMKPLYTNERNLELWRHSIITAVACEHLAVNLRIMDTNEAFVIGFMHDIGKLIINKYDEETLKRIDEEYEKSGDLIDVERKCFGTDHAVIGSLLAKKWQLSILLTNIIKYHHNPLKSLNICETELVYLADMISKEDFSEKDLDLKFIKKLNLNMDRIQFFRKTILDKAELLLAELLG